MDDLLKRRMYTVIVRECRAAGLPRPVEIDVYPIAEFRWNIGYKYSYSEKERIQERSGRPKPATKNPETALRKAWRDLVKKGAFIFWIEAFIESGETMVEVMKVDFNTKTCTPKRFTQLVTEKSEVLSWRTKGY